MVKKTIFWGPYWRSPILRNYHIGVVYTKILQDRLYEGIEGLELSLNPGPCGAVPYSPFHDPHEAMIKKRSSPV